MTKRAHAAAWLFLCVLTLVLCPLWTGAQAVHRLEADLRSAHDVFGPRVGGWLAGALHAVDLQVLAPSATDAAAPSRQAPAAAKPMARLGPFAAWVVSRAEQGVSALRVQWLRSALRAMVFGTWALLLAPLAIAAVVDGLARRAVKVANLGYQNPAAFALASHAVIACTLLPCFMLVAPFEVSHWFMPVWGLVAMLPLNVALGHLQPVFTR